MADPLWRHIPDVAAYLIILGVHGAFSRWTPHRSTRRAVWAAYAWSLASFILGLPGIANQLPSWEWLAWLRAAGIAWGVCSLGVFILWLAWRKVPKTRYNPERRRLLLATKSTVVAAPVAAIGYGMYIARHGLQLRTVDVTAPGLPRDLDGLRIVQLTDIHCSAFLSARDVARAVALANETRPHVAVVTGDLVTSASDPLDDCLKELSKLRADAGVLGCLGNHEIYARAEDYAAETGRRLGLRFLRGEAIRLSFGSARLNLAGVDYQRMRRPYLRNAERLVDPTAFNVLLSHNPDVFPVAVAKGFSLTVAGHTHGGQITVEILDQPVTIPRFFTPYIYGLYPENGGFLYVSRGIGTVALPARLGAPPEVSLIRLCAI